MGHLLLIHESFELGKVVKNDRDRILLDFCKMACLAQQKEDIFYVSPNLFTHTYSYGDIYGLYKSWEEINKDKNLRGISNKSYQLFCNLFFSCPLGAKKIDNISFKNLTGHKGYAGFEFATSCNPYIKCEKTWNEWKTEWFSKNQNSINWEEDEFLPNKKYIDQILFEEIVKDGKKDKWENSYKKDTITTFYEETMKRKCRGRGKEAYITEIGKKICLSNYYTFEKDLTKKESKATSSLRKIFSITRKGKKQYISLDFEKGMFEYHDNKGKHLGEYRFDGGKNSKAKEGHNFKTIS
jgi:hypothetical protein